MDRGAVLANRFVLEELAGQGAMGAVYRALDRDTGQRVAVKVLISSEAMIHERFAREVRVLAALEHPAIVRYVAHGESEQGAFLAMEWLDGIDLAARLDAGPLGVGDTLALVGRMADALAAAHAQGVIHRDLKPSNVFLPGGDVRAARLVDFGVARMGGGRGMTRVGMAIGTPGYMAPEQARGDEDVDARVDVFALGCVAYECLTGRCAFEGEHVMAVLAKILLAQTPRARDHVPEVPAELDALLTRMLAKDREQRPRDGRALADELAALQITHSVGGVPVPSAPVLTVEEQRLQSVVLVTTTGPFAEDSAEHPAPGSDPTRLAASQPGNVPLEPHRRGSSVSDVRVAVAPFGARVEPLADGSVLVCVSGGGAATDQAAQAARCALSLRAMLPSATIALATGRGANLAQTAGAVIDRAAQRLISERAAAERAEPIAPIRIDDVTAGLLDAQFSLAPTDAGWILLGTRDRAVGARTLLGRVTPCVGRERELRMLRAMFDECVDESVARVALVTGAAGVGKSRVRDEFVRQLASASSPFEIWVARADAMTACAPFALLAEAIRSAAGVSEGDAPDDRREKLVARVARAVAPSERQRVAEFLGEIASIDAFTEPSVPLRAARRDPVLMGDQMRRAWEDFATAACARGPVLLLIEDLQWGDLPSVKFIDAGLRVLAGAAFFVAAFGRPEVHETFPRLWSERALTEIRLGELSRKSSERLVRAVLGDGVAPDVLSRVVELSGGNAFFLEELIRAVAEGRGAALPDTVVAMVQARLESLDPALRRILRAASVFGPVFWQGGVRALSGAVRAGTASVGVFEELVAKEWIVASPTARFAGEREFLFRHESVQKAAYEMLTPADRTLGHKLAGEWLESAGERRAAVLADHYERGGAVEPAVRWYAQAASDALAGNDFASAIAFGDVGIRCGARGPARAEIRRRQAEAHRWLADYPSAQRTAGEAFDLIDPGDAIWFESAGELAIAAGTLGHVEALVTIADALLEVDPEAAMTPSQVVATLQVSAQLIRNGRGERSAQLRNAVEARGGAVLAEMPAAAGRFARLGLIEATHRGDSAAALDWGVEALQHFRAAGDLRGACLLSVDIGYACLELGLYEDAEPPLREALADAERLGIQVLAALAMHNLGMVVARTGRVDEAIALQERSLAIVAGHPDVRVAGGTYTYLATILFEQGRVVEAEAAAGKAREALVSHANLQGEAIGVAIESLLAQERVREAMALAEEGMALLNGPQPLEAGDTYLALACGEACWAAGRGDEARRWIATAYSRVMERAAKIANDEWRASFLARVPHNARIAERQREWGG